MLKRSLTPPPHFVALTAITAAAIGSACAGAVYPDTPPEPTPTADASTDGSVDPTPDASTDAPSDAPADAPSDAPTDGAAPYNGPIGNACSSDAECGDMYRCQITVPGGYCVKDCGGPGAPCPEGTLCSPVPFSRVAGACMKACSSSAECRPGYACDVVYLFPSDPGSPKSGGPVCWEPYPKDGGP